jgi:hypothetical protein
LAYASRVDQVVVDSDDDISLGANESSDDEQERKAKALAKNNIRRLPIPGSSKILKSSAGSGNHKNGNGLHNPPQKSTDIESMGGGKDNTKENTSVFDVNSGINHPWSANINGVSDLRESPSPQKQPHEEIKFE